MKTHKIPFLTNNSLAGISTDLSITINETTTNNPRTNVSITGVTVSHDVDEILRLTYNDEVSSTAATSLNSRFMVTESNTYDRSKLTNLDGTSYTNSPGTFTIG